ncbi:MAG: rod shape-determining protein MreD [Treponema sp.]|nr:rod shape-determining protein MreD [Treponema sp.]
MAKSLLLSSLIVFCTAIIESSILSNITFLLVVPDLILISSIYFSTLNGRLYGETNGLVSGLILDFITGAPLGMNCLYRVLIGYFFGLFSESIIVTGIVMPMLTVGIATIGKRLMLILISLFYPKINLNIYGFISYEFLFEFIANVLLAPVIFKFLSFFKKTLSIKDTKEMVDNIA